MFIVGDNDKWPIAQAIRKTRHKAGFCLVEAAGQLIHIFRYGPDYSFTCIAAGEGVLWIILRMIHPSTPWPEY
jgi:hypothetical protein